MRGSGEEGEKTELLVFGYACKVFRDDEKAASIDAGAHLIPWMGNDDLRIDRYDGRGALYDLALYEPNDNVTIEIDEEDKVLEEMCDEERYRSMYINEEEELTYKEEEAKRQHQQNQNRGEVAYSYDVPTMEQLPSDVSRPKAVQPFCPPPELQVPPDMPVPKTLKHNAIIERTALFLAQQGAQMEILMKVKQQGNKNFDFLSHTDSLHGYYNHLKRLIKSGSYVPRELDLDDDDVVDTDDSDYYLHPSLITATSAEPPGPPQTTVEEKPPQKPTRPDTNSPPDFVQKIIELMVKFVVRNGLRFEAAILKQSDVRFSFLNPKNPYNAFYKLQLSKKLQSAVVSEEQVATNQTVSPSGESPESNGSLKRKPLPVCFSIKKPKETEGLEVSSALPLEESSEEDESDSSTPPIKQAKIAQEPISTVLEKHLKKGSEGVAPKVKKEVLRHERKIKVAQFLKDLKKKNE